MKNEKEVSVEVNEEGKIKTELLLVLLSIISLGAIAVMFFKGLFY